MTSLKRDVAATGIRVGTRLSFARTDGDRATLNSAMQLVSLAALIAEDPSLGAQARKLLTLAQRSADSIGR